MTTLDQFLETYADLEKEIGRLMSMLCSETCGMCTACCCRADICEEVGESAFLSCLLTQQGRTPEEMDDRYGWLELGGCSLTIGRPPVCYAYFCDELLERFPGPEMQEVARVLGRLLYHCGMNAQGSLHLTEIRNRSALDQVDWKGLNQQLEEARSALQAAEGYLNSGRLTEQGRAALAQITSDDP